jgi:hypothetical protein
MYESLKDILDFEYSDDQLINDPFINNNILMDDDQFVNNLLADDSIDNNTPLQQTVSNECTSNECTSNDDNLIKNVKIHKSTLERSKIDYMYSVGVDGLEIQLYNIVYNKQLKRVNVVIHDWVAYKNRNITMHFICMRDNDNGEIIAELEFDKISNVVLYDKIAFPLNIPDDINLTHVWIVSDANIYHVLPFIKLSIISRDY